MQSDAEPDYDLMCLQRYREVSSADPTCMYETARAFFSDDETLHCIIYADCRRSVGHITDYVMTRITVMYDDLHRVHNCDGHLTLGQCPSDPENPDPGAPTLSVADAQVSEGPDATLAFTVTLSRPVSETVWVEYVTLDGTATAEADYRPVRGVVTFASPQTAKIISVPVLDDTEVEFAETMTLELRNAHGGPYIADDRATGIILDSDVSPSLRNELSPGAWLTGFGRAMASGLVDRLGEHLAAPQLGSHVTLGGRPIAPASVFGDRLPGANAHIGGRYSRDRIAGTPDLLEERGGAETGSLGMSGSDLLLGSSFRFSTEDVDAAEGRWSGWGQAAPLRFSEANGGSGDGAIGLFGTEYQRGRLLAGLALSHGAVDGSLALGGNDWMDAELTGVHPYFRLALTDRLAVWSALGFATGELALSDGSGDSPGSLSQHRHVGIEMSMAALGAGGALLTPEEADGFALSVKSDAYLMRMKSGAVPSAASGNLAGTEIEASRLRLSLYGSRSFELGPESSLTPSFEAGVRRDGGDSAAGTGVEMDASLGYAAPALAVAARLGGIARSDDRDEEWRASVSAHHDVAVSGPGFSVSPSWDVLWGGTAKPEHRIGVRVRLPLGPAATAAYR